MKKHRLFGLGLGALGIVACGVASAQQPYYGNDYGTYLGASVGEIMYNEEGLPQMNPTIAEFRIGQQFSQYLAVEGRIGTSVSGGSTYAYGEGYRVNAQAIYAAYVKGMLPFSPWISGYAIAGLGGAQWHRDYPSYDTNDIAISFGFGAEFRVGGNASLDLEWARLTSGTNPAYGADYGYNANQLTFGVNWRF